LYVQLFQVEVGAADAPLVDLDDEDPSGRDDWNDSPDLGVEKFNHLDDAQLNTLLQFPGGRPTLFAEFRSQTGLSAWDNDMSKAFIKENDDMRPLSLLWHQRVGIAAVIDKIWLPEQAPGEVPGILVADEVGVGKTALTMGTIAFVIDAFWVQEVAAGRGKPDGATVDINIDNVRKAPILGEWYICLLSVLCGPHREPSPCLRCVS
jgi:hypothetical protein